VKLSSTIDFQEVKSAATVEQVIGFLGLKLTQKEDSFRGVCPLCKSGSREFVVTGSRKLFHCFKCKKGGDMLKLVSEAKGIGVKEAAAELAKACGVEKKSTPAPTEKKAFDVDKYAEGLDPEHKALEPLGISADTLRTWKAGYSATGVNRGRLALPIESLQNGTLGYMGMELNPDQPTLIFPNGIDPRLYIFGAGHATGKELYLTRTPLDVLHAWDSGLENALSFLTETISSSQLQYLSALMDHGQVEAILLM
jgi:CHC2 zinc finger